MDEETTSAVENPQNGEKRTRASVLDHFTHISNENEGVRVKNGVFLLKHLCTTTNTENEGNELRYALMRLIRGLGSARWPAKIGFYSTLVALLTTVPSITVTQILEHVQKQLHTGDSSSKSEIGDVYMGQILLCGALIRSGLFLKASLEEQSKVLEILLKAGKKRSYLGLASASFVADLLLKVENNGFNRFVWPSLKSEIVKPWQEQTLDTIYLLLLVQNRFPKALKGSGLGKHLGSKQILCESNMKELCDVLMNILSVASLKHPVYDLVSKEVVKSNIVSAFAKQLNQELFKPNRHKLLAVSLITRNILTSIEDTTQIPELITDNFIEETILYFTNYHNNNYDQEFHEYTTKFFDSLHACFKEERVDDKVKIAILKKLLFYPGTFMVEKITKSRLLQQLISTLKEDGVKKLSKLYKSVILAEKDKVVDQEGATKMWMNTERIYAAQLLAKLLAHPSVQGEIDWKIKHLKFLINLGILRGSKHESVGVELAGTLRDIFYRALDQKFQKLEDLSNVLLQLSNHINASLSPETYTETLRVDDFTQDDFEMWQKAHTTITKLSAKTDQKHILVFRILFLHMSLQLFKDKDLAVSSLNELFQCYDRVKAPKKSKKLENGAAEDPEWIEVVVDLFLNLLSHNSHLLRSIIGCVFPHLCRYMTPSGVHQILSVLDPKNEDNPLSKTNEEESESESESSSDDDEQDADEDEEEEESEDEPEEQMNETDKLRMAVRQALGNDGYQTDEESIDLDEMSETEGRRLNDALAEAFKQFRPNRGRNKKKQTKDEETLTHFRVRVLDLIEIYLNSEPPMLSSLEIMLPLLQLLEFTIRDVHQNPLQMRVRHCLKKLTGLKKFQSLEGITEDNLSELIKSLLNKGTKSALIIQDMSNEISDCSIFVIKCSQIVRSDDSMPKKTKKSLKAVMEDILVDATKFYFNQRNCLIPYNLFKSIFQANWDGNFVLVPLIFGYVFSDSTRPFRRSQALELLQIFYTYNRIRTSDTETFKSHVRSHEEEFCSKVTGMLEEFCLNPNGTAIKERFVYHVFNLLKVIASGDDRGSTKIDWKAVGETVRKYRSYVTLSKDAKQAYNQLCAKLNIPNQVKMQNHTVKLNTEQEEHEENEEARSPVRSKQNRKKSGEGKKLKKEARELRIQSLSEGFSNSFSFSDVNMDTVVNSADDSEGEDTEKSSRKRTNSEGRQMPFSKKKKRKSQPVS